MTDTVSVKTSVHFKAFQVPNFAQAVASASPTNEDWKAPQTIAIKHLEPAALDALAWTWLGHLYASVGRDVPFKLPDNMLASAPAKAPWATQ